MAKFKNRINQRYGRLVVIEYAGKDNRNKHLWKCKCDCGNIIDRDYNASINLKNAKQYKVIA